MAVKSIVDIDVNDEKFKSFTALFDKYHSALNETPEAWQSAGAAAGKMNDQAQGAAAGFLAMRETQDKFLESLNKTTKTLHRHGTEWNVIQDHARRTYDYVSGMAKFLIGGAIGLGIAGFGLGIVGLFGLRDLARDISDQRNQALQTGSQIGQEKAFAQNQGIVLSNPAGVFQSSVALNSSLNKANPLVSILGINANGDTYHDATALLRAVRNHVRGMSNAAVKNYYGTMPELFQAAGLQFGDVLELAHLRPGELARNTTRGNEAVALLHKSDAQGAAAQHAWSVFQNIFGGLKNAFQQDLLKLLPPTERLLQAIGKDLHMILGSQAAKDVIKEVGVGIDKFSKFLLSGKFEQAIKGFESDIQEFINFIQNAGSIISNVSGFTGYAWNNPGSVFTGAASDWWDKIKANPLGYLAPIPTMLFDRAKSDFQHNKQSIANYVNGLGASPQSKNSNTHIVVPEVHVKSLIKIQNLTGNNVIASMNSLQGGS
ncbi:MAG: hypothetical protein ACRESI_06475 [Gammaproteobacteria bacterium]